MSTATVPTGHQHIMPYLIVKNAPAFITFMRNVFGATEKMKIIRSEQQIMHAELQIGESTIMFADSTEEFAVQNAGLFVYVKDADETYNKALQEGGIVRTAISNQDYGRSGGVTDPFGNVWWITSTL